MSIYNEINFLPLKIQWCRSNNIQLYVCDNMSTDGSWELLQKEKIPSHQYDTEGIFSEVKMQNEIIKTLNILSPDWVLYMGCDMFFDIPKDYNEYDYVTFFYFCPRNTGEERTLPFNPFYTFQYASGGGPIKFLFKWSDKVVFKADEIIIPGEGHPTHMFALNYGDTKPKEEREETKARRQKAWNKGEPIAWGSHYIDGSRINWTWDKAILMDMKKSSHWNTIERIAKECGLI